MRIETDQLLYDDEDDRCELILCSSQAVVRENAPPLTVAFLTVIQKEGEGTGLKHRFGEWDYNDVEASIQRIMERGGDWPLEFMPPVHDSTRQS